MARKASRTSPLGDQSQLRSWGGCWGVIGLSPPDVCLKSAAHGHGTRPFWSWQTMGAWHTAMAVALLWCCGQRQYGHHVGPAAPKGLARRGSSTPQAACGSTRGARRLPGSRSWGSEQKRSVWGDADKPERDVEPLGGEPHEEHCCGEHGNQTGHVSHSVRGGIMVVSNGSSMLGLIR